VISFSFYCEDTVSLNMHAFNEGRDSSVGIATRHGLWHDCSETATVPQPTDIVRTQYTKCCLCIASWGWASNARYI
jgi:hypothetical protein